MGCTKPFIANSGRQTQSTRRRCSYYIQSAKKEINEDPSRTIEWGLRPHDKLDGCHYSNRHRCRRRNMGTSQQKAFENGLGSRQIPQAYKAPTEVTCPPTCVFGERPSS